VRSCTRGLVLVLLGLAPAVLAQEPPADQGGSPAEEQKDEKKQEPQAEPQAPAPAPEVADSAPPAAEGAIGSVASTEPAPAPPPRRGHPAITWPLDAAAIDVHMRGIAENYETVAALEVLGKSQGGLEILALRLGLREEHASDRPALLLVDSQGTSSAGPEAMLELAWSLAGRFETDERVRALLTRTTLVIVPALDPDARASAAPGASEAAPRPSFERNFPSGWQPEAVRPGSGRVPLARSETLSAARFLANLRGCAVMLGFTPAVPRREPYAGAELPAADREVFAKLGAALELEGASPLVPWFELGSPGGSLFDFAYQARGIYPLFFVLPPEDELAAGDASFRAQVAARVERCLTLLPRVELAQEGIERVASDTWQLDVRIQNVGIVPTSSALARHRDPQADVSLRLEGAKLLATAKKPDSSAPYTDASFQVRAPLSGGTLAGGEGRWLRLFLEAAPGAEVRVMASSPWAGGSTVVVTLP